MSRLEERTRTASEWTSVSLGEVIDLLVGFPFKSDRYVSDPDAPRLLRGDNIAQGNIRWDGAKRWPLKAIDNVNQYWLRQGDVVLAMDRPWIEAGLKFSSVRSSDLPALLVQRVARLRGGDRLDTRFLNYVIGCRDFTEYVLSVQTGTAVPHISARQIKEFKFFLPPLPEQRAIAHILGTLDDKIELNRRMNETLEEMARALFKSWFVDFDPVHAKATLKHHAANQALRQAAPTPATEAAHSGITPPLRGSDWTAERAWTYLDGMDADIAALFPDSFVDSELGPIPAGWEVKPLPDAMAINPPRPLRKGSVAPYLDMANMPTTGHTPAKVIERPFGSGMRFVNGDTLLARITPCLENGKTAYVDFLEEGQVGWGSTEYIVLRPKPPCPNEFAYCLARSADFREFVIQSMTGSSGRQRVPAEALSHYLMAVPVEGIVEGFGKVVQPLFVRASNAARDSSSLASLRDTLLPKLISGEIRVPEAEKLVGDAV